MSKKDKTLTYEAAYQELNQILAALQNHDISLEDMTAHLRRARELILFCREKLHITELELQSIFSEEEE